ncbi:MAG: hypothetical protein IJ148_00110 [Bacteroidaceae bacterium]|nr:hypothetical protein [Bacteroidaceae bacterium]
MIDAKTLRLVTQNGLQQFAQGFILDGIAALRTLLPYCAKEAIISVEAENLEKNYHYMLSFLRGGGSDEKRNDVQAKMQRQGVALLEQASRTIRISLDSDIYCNALNRLRDVYGGQDALLDKWNSLLTPEEAGDVQDDIFDLLWTSPFWTAEDTAFWYDFLMQQRDMVQQHLEGAIFLSLWEHYDAEKMQLLGLMAESDCRRTHITALCHLLLLRIRHKELVPLMPSLPQSLLSRKEKKQIAQVQHELLLMLVSEKDMEKEMKEAEAITKELFSGKQPLNAQNIKDMISLRGRYLRNRLQRGLDINLSKIPLLHTCKYMRRVSHWFMPFDKTHPLFQSVMIDEKGREKENLSVLVDLIMDCDVDKLAMLYLVAHDKDFSKAVQQLDEQELPDNAGSVIPEYNLRFIMQDLYRFFGHSPLHAQLANPFREEVSLLDFPELATMFSIDDTVACSELLFELGHYKQVLAAIDDVISREGASASALLLKGRVMRERKKYAEAISCGRSAELLEPENLEVLHFLVECYAMQGRYEEELEYLQKLSDVMPDDKSLPRLIAAATDKVGRREEALALFFKLDYEASPDDEGYDELASSIADIALALDKLDIAERYTRKELDLSEGKNWEAHLRMGHIQLLRKHRSTAATPEASTEADFVEQKLPTEQSEEGKANDWKDAIDSYEQFINCFVGQHVQEASVAIAKFRESWGMLEGKGIKRADLLLIQDILQAAASEILK